jgi:hypothetical protein
VDSALGKLRALFEACKATYIKFVYFCKTLVVQLKHMIFQRAVICQHELQQVMVEERLYRLSQTSLTSPVRGTSSLPPSFQSSTNTLSPHSTLNFCVQGRTMQYHTGTRQNERLFAPLQDGNDILSKVVGAFPAEECSAYLREGLDFHQILLRQDLL